MTSEYLCVAGVLSRWISKSISLTLMNEIYLIIVLFMWKLLLIHNQFCINLFHSYKS